MSQKPQITEYWKRAFKFGLFVEEVFLLSLKAFFFFFNDGVSSFAIYAVLTPK